MTRVVHLVLEDGTVFTGESFGAQRDGWGEVVFNTTMTGYQEVLTDPSYAGQMVALTYPLVGNYGINRRDFESRRIQVSALIVRQHCDLPSHASSDMTLHAFLEEYNIPGISGVDTRALTRRLRTRGVMTGLITADDPDRAKQRLAEIPRYDDLDLVSTVTTPGGYAWDHGSEHSGLPNVPAAGRRPAHPGDRRRRQVQHPAPVAEPGLRGVHRARDYAGQCHAGYAAQRRLLLSPWPRRSGATWATSSDNLGQLIGQVPIMGICLGHQLAARALGAGTYKLKFGHRGGNHPVKGPADRAGAYHRAEPRLRRLDRITCPPA